MTTESRDRKALRTLVAAVRRRNFNAATCACVEGGYAHHALAQPDPAAELAEQLAASRRIATDLSVLADELYAALSWALNFIDRVDRCLPTESMSPANKVKYQWAGAILAKYEGSKS